MINLCTHAHTHTHTRSKQVSWRPEDLENDWKWWGHTSPEERKLYSDITKRVEEGLLRLEQEARQDRQQVEAKKDQTISR